MKGGIKKKNSCLTDLMSRLNVSQTTALMKKLLRCNDHPKKFRSMIKTPQILSKLLARYSPCFPLALCVEIPRPFGRRNTEHGI